jgi:hypothetical protein
MRNLTGSVLAVLGAAATLVSPWQGWYDTRHGSTYKFWEVFGNGISPSRSGVTDSVFLVFLVTAVVAVVGAVLRSRALVLVAGVAAFGFTVLWMVRQGQAAGELLVSDGHRGLGAGVAWALGGGLLMIIGGLLMGGRRRTRVAPVTDAPEESADAAARPEPWSDPDDDRPEPDRPPDRDLATTSTTTFTEEEARMLGLHEDIPADSPTAIPTTKPPAR